jgi:hypothetical protein
MKSKPALIIMSFAQALLMTVCASQAVGAQPEQPKTTSNDDMKREQKIDEHASPCAHVQIGKSFSTFFAMGLVNWEVINVSPEFQRATVRDKSGGLDPKTVPCSTVP